MKNGSYQFQLRMAVPLGMRNGLLDLSIKNEKIEGFLTMFTIQRPIIQGTCHENQIQFSGEMQTLTKCFSYQAIGTIFQTGIDLVFHTERGDYPATGERRRTIL